MSNLVRTLKEVSRREVFLALAFVVLVLGETLLRGLEPRTPLLILGLLAPLPLVSRIRFPLEVLGTSVAVLIAGELVAHRDDYPVALGCVALVAAYSAAAHLRGRRAEAADFLVIAAIVGSAAVAASKNWNGSVATNLVAALISLTILFRGAWIAGRWMQGRRDRERSAIAEREQKAQAALREERARIARELHDVVAHAMSVIVLQARGARHSMLERPDEAREAVDAVERTASHALSEMRKLRASATASSPSPASPTTAGPLPDSPLPAGGPPAAVISVLLADDQRLVHVDLRVGAQDHAEARAVLIRYAEDAFEVEVTGSRLAPSTRSSTGRPAEALPRGAPVAVSCSGIWSWPPSTATRSRIPAAARERPTLPRRGVLRGPLARCGMRTGRSRPEAS